MHDFELISPFEPKGDQPEAIRKLVENYRKNATFQTLLGVTGSGKTFTMANVIAALGKPTLVMTHNKTLAAQLYSEFKDFFPKNAVGYFVSYYDYYQPEAYIPQRDIYIEKEATINQEIDRLRLAATSVLMSRKDVIIVASVSCIYGLGSPEEYREMYLHLNKGDEVERDSVLKNLSVFNTNGMTAILVAEHSGCGGMLLKCFPLTKSLRTGWNCSGMRWIRFP